MPHRPVVKPRSVELDADGDSDRRRRYRMTRIELLATSLHVWGVTAHSDAFRASMSVITRAEQLREERLARNESVHRAFNESLETIQTKLDGHSDRSRDSSASAATRTESTL